MSTTPNTVAYSKEACDLLSLNPEECERPEFPLIFSGNAPLPEGRPYAQVLPPFQLGNTSTRVPESLFSHFVPHHLVILPFVDSKVSSSLVFCSAMVDTSLVTGLVNSEMDAQYPLERL